MYLLHKYVAYLYLFVMLLFLIKCLHFILFQHFEFPIVSMFDNFKNKCLVDALSCRNMPLVQVKPFPNYINSDL